MHKILSQSDIHRVDCMGRSLTIKVYPSIPKVYGVSSARKLFRLQTAFQVDRYGPHLKYSSLFLECIKRSRLTTKGAR